MIQQNWDRFLYEKYAGHILEEPFAIYLAMQENCVL